MMPHIRPHKLRADCCLGLCRARHWRHIESDVVQPPAGGTGGGDCLLTAFVCSSSLCHERFSTNMRLWLLLAVLVCAGRAGAAPLSGNATREVLLGSERFLQAPGVLLEGGAPLASSQVVTASVCAQTCLAAAPNCTWFTASCDSDQASVGAVRAGCRK